MALMEKHPSMEERSTSSLQEIEAVADKTSPSADAPVSPEDAARDKALTRKILWKIDLRIIPLLAVLYCCCFLDRTNVGNAKIIGLATDLGLNSHQWGTALAVFYVFYILAEIPSSLLLKKVSPRIWLAGLGVACGILGMCIAFAKNYGGFLVIRIILGLFEGGLLPGIILYFSGMYTRAELGVRIGVFYTSASLAGAFGGLLARGFSAIGPHGGIKSGWQWIMLIEGLLTIVVSVVVCILLPNNVSTAGFLTPEERKFAAQRLQLDITSRSSAVEFEAEKFSWLEVRRGVLSLRVWLTAIACFCILSGIYSFGIFLPTIIKGLGYTADAAQLWSVIPYAVASVVTVAVAILSDRLRLRGTFMLFTMPIAIIGYAAIASLDKSKIEIKYGMTVLMATGLYASVPPCLAWMTNNSAGHYKRATATGLMMAIANCGGFVGSFIYPSSEAPRYVPSHMIILALLIFGWVCVSLNLLYCAKINKDKANGKYDKYTGYGDDRDPLFKMTL